MADQQPGDEPAAAGGRTRDNRVEPGPGARVSRRPWTHRPAGAGRRPCRRRRRRSRASRGGRPGWPARTDPARPDRPEPTRPNRPEPRTRLRRSSIPPRSIRTTGRRCRPSTPGPIRTRPGTPSRSPRAADAADPGGPARAHPNRRPTARRRPPAPSARPTPAPMPPASAAARRSRPQPPPLSRSPGAAAGTEPKQAAQPVNRLPVQPRPAARRPPPTGTRARGHPTGSRSRSAAPTGPSPARPRPGPGSRGRPAGRRRPQRPRPLPTIPALGAAAAATPPAGAAPPASPGPAVRAFRAARPALLLRRSDRLLHLPGRPAIPGERRSSLHPSSTSTGATTTPAGGPPTGWPSRRPRSGGASDSSFAGVYGDGDGKRVTIFGMTGWRFDPGRDVRTELDRLSTISTSATCSSFPAGEFGVYERCGVGRSTATRSWSAPGPTTAAWPPCCSPAAR